MIETLDIRISDSTGERPYENYSGGEKFRINFAVRLALSRILAHRSGARLRTLVIDEGSAARTRKVGSDWSRRSTPFRINLPASWSSPTSMNCGINSRRE